MQTLLLKKLLHEYKFSRKMLKTSFHSPKPKLPTDSILNQKRQITDKLADAIVEKIYQSANPAEISRLIASVSKNDQPLPENLPDFVKDFFTETTFLPDFAEPKKMQRGHAFFARHAQAIMSILGYYALPYCYAAADGAEVLYLSEKIRHNTTQRLLETGQFLLDVMSANAFQPNGSGFRSCQKVRLIHATARYHVLKSKRWNFDWGMPVNQEDMAGTNGAFSYITLRGLDKLGISYSQQEASDFLHLWKVIGCLTGVETDILPDTLKQAYDLDKKIKERHFRKSQAGTELTQALIRSFEDFVPNPALQALVPSYLRFMLGKEVADLLEVPESRSALLDSVWFTGLRTFNAVSSSFSGISGTSSVIHALMLQLEKQNQVRVSEKNASV